MKSRRVLIGSPVHQQPAIMKEFLASLSELKHDNVTIAYLFMDDNEDEESSRLLVDFAANQENVMIHKSQEKTEHYHCDEYTHHWKEEQIWKVAQMKDEIINYAIKKRI